MISHVGRNYGRLVVIAEAERNKFNQRRVLVECQCGERKTIVLRSLVGGATISCGCANWEIVKQVNRTHGHSALQSPEYRAWKNMKARCTADATKTVFRNYGARGVKVAQEWQESFEAFLAHIGPKPNAELTLDRIDNNKGYEPGNVRWATRKQQYHNSRRKA